MMAIGRSIFRPRSRPFFLLGLFAFQVLTGMHAQQSQTCRLYVKDKFSQDPISNATIVIRNNGFRRLTEAGGVALFTNLESKRYTFEVSRKGYRSKTLEFSVAADNDSNFVDVQLTLKPKKVIIAGSVVYENGFPANSKAVVLNYGQFYDTTLLDSRGEYFFVADRGEIVRAENFQVAVITEFNQEVSDD